MKTTFETFEDLKEAALKIGYTKIERKADQFVVISDGDSEVNYFRNLDGTWRKGA